MLGRSFRNICSVCCCSANVLPPCQGGAARSLSDASCSEPSPSRPAALPLGSSTPRASRSYPSSCFFNLLSIVLFNRGPCTLRQPPVTTTRVPLPWGGRWPWHSSKPCPAKQRLLLAPSLAAWPRVGSVALHGQTRSALWVLLRCSSASLPAPRVAALRGSVSLVSSSCL